MHTKIDEFIDTKVLPEYKQIIANFRTLIKSEYPAIKEEMRGGT